MSLWTTNTVKIVSGVAILLECFIFSSIAFFPVKKRFQESRSLFSIMNCFTAGIFFAMGFDHILREANEKFIDIHEAEIGLEAGQAESQGIVNYSQYHIHIFWIAFFIIFSIDNVFLGQHSHSLHDNCDHESNMIELSYQTDEMMDKLIDNQSVDSQCKKNQKKQHERSAFILLMALSIHAFITGVAIGIQTTITQVINIVIGTVMHKWAEALALGFNLIKADFNMLKIVLTLVVFSLVTPMGIVLGNVVGGYDETVDIILMSVSASTFFYMSVVEILCDEMSDRSLMGAKLGFFLLGYVIINVLTTYFDND